MTFRIRYKKSGNNGLLISTQNFEGMKGALYQVILDTNNMTYKIRNIRRQRYVRSTEMDGRKPPKCIRTLRDQAKKALKSMGVSFDYEFRGINLE